ncbi:hypothetical protein [Pelagibaculum spongiae]|uniref:hypothetical protein n=1 Tax=Pelagibaculum spongiae TaxID=2080658 RepID=UPI001314C12C|nr:hypothetical protein [Pelagibaculum spongiae]
MNQAISALSDISIESDSDHENTNKVSMLPAKRAKINEAKDAGYILDSSHSQHQM